MSTESGKKAEKVAVKYLESKGYKIINMNWRRPRCEIDIVATKKKRGFKRQKTVHFFEVKYRRRDQQGTGIDYITPVKLKQMKFAASIWASENDWQGDYELGAVEVTGSDFEVTMYLPTLDT